MSDVISSRTVSRSAWLELREGQALVKDGYEFLDEKAMLLAAEMLEQKKLYAESRERFLRLAGTAADTLALAAADLGLNGVQVHPANNLEGPAIEIEERSCIGQIMIDARFIACSAGPSRRPASRSGATESVGTAFFELLQAGAGLAALSTNLERLTREYRRTWRRVRALENVVLPEIKADLAAMEDHLDLVEQEEIIRVRTAGVERT